MCAASFLPILFADPVTPEDLDFAIRVVSRTSGIIDRNGVAQWRLKRLRKFEQLVGHGADFLNNVFRPHCGCDSFSNIDS